MILEFKHRGIFFGHSIHPSGMISKKYKKKHPLGCLQYILAPRTGFEPVTCRLTAECSTTELPRNIILKARGF